MSVSHSQPESTATSGGEGTAFSPSPWSLDVGDHTHRYVHIIDADERTVFYKYGSGSAAEADRDEANGRLAAAGPDLLAALQGLLAGISDSFFPPGTYERAEAAIAKATGLALGADPKAGA